MKQNEVGFCYINHIKFFKIPKTYNKLTIRLVYFKELNLIFFNYDYVIYK
jgi:hypothetical protein